MPREGAAAGAQAPHPRLAQPRAWSARSPRLGEGGGQTEPGPIHCPPPVPGPDALPLPTTSALDTSIIPFTNKQHTQQSTPFTHRPAGHHVHFHAFHRRMYSPLARPSADPACPLSPPSSSSSPHAPASSPSRPSPTPIGPRSASRPRVPRASGSEIRWLADAADLGGKRFPSVTVRAVSSDRAGAGRGRRAQAAAGGGRGQTSSYPPRSPPLGESPVQSSFFLRAEGAVGSGECCCCADEKDVGAVAVNGGVTKGRALAAAAAAARGSSIDHTESSSTSRARLRTRRLTFDALHQESDEDDDGLGLGSGDPIEEEDDSTAATATDAASAAAAGPFGGYSLSLPLSRTSTRSSLSRAPLFDSDSDSDDLPDLPESLSFSWDSDLSSAGPATPSSLGSPPALASSPSSGRRIVSAPATFDPLVSPPSGTPTVLSFGRWDGGAGGSKGRRASAGWLPGNSGRQPTTARFSAGADETADLPTARRVSLSSLSTSPPSSVVLAANPRGGLSASRSSSGPTGSLLTQSLRTLHTRLPNLALAAGSLGQSIGEVLAGLAGTTVSRELEGLEEGEVEEVPWVTVGGAGARVGEDGERREERRQPMAISGRVLASQSQALPLSVFSPPNPLASSSPPLERRGATSPPAPPPPSSPADPAAASPGDDNDDPPGLPPPAGPRLISNQKHLYMLSLEIAMMRADKIRSPLRPRAVVVRRAEFPVSARGGGRPSSPLRNVVKRG